jgi:hypothetical protein
VTKRDKRDIQKTGLRAVKRDSPFFRRAVASRHPTAEQILTKELAILKAEVRLYLDGYTSRGIAAEGRALVRLRKAAAR